MSACHRAAFRMIWLASTLAVTRTCTGYASPARRSRGFITRPVKRSSGERPGLRTTGTRTQPGGGVGSSLKRTTRRDGVANAYAWSKRVLSRRSARPTASRPPLSIAEKSSVRYLSRWGEKRVIPQESAAGDRSGAHLVRVSQNQTPVSRRSTLRSPCADGVSPRSPVSGSGCP